MENKQILNLGEKIISELKIDDDVITFIKYPINEGIKNSKNFTGFKIMHPFVFKEKIETYNFKIKKRGKVITKKKTKTSHVYGDDFISKTIEQNILKDDTFFHLKHDGACGYVLYNPGTNTHSVYARYDVKKNNNTNDYQSVPNSYIPCENKPGPEGTHWPHFRPCDEDPKQYKWFINAFNEFKESGQLENIKESFTFELMGKKSNYCISDPINKNSKLIPHGTIIINIPPKMRTIEGFKKIFKAIPFIEGFVVYCNDVIYKIRRDMFSDDNGEKMEWGKKSIQEIYDELCRNNGDEFIKSLENFENSMGTNFKNGIGISATI